MNQSFDQAFFGKSSYPQDGIYNGYMDSLMIFPYALTENEVRLAMAVGIRTYICTYIHLCM